MGSAEQNIAEYLAAAREVLSDLRAAGFDVDTVGELRRGKRYDEAVPVLLKWLPRVELPAVKEDIVRTLSVPWAKSARAALLDEFEKEGNVHLRWAIGNALEVLADDSIFERLVLLVSDDRYGYARQMLALALAKVKNARAVDVLTTLLADKEVAGHALKALARRRAQVPVKLLLPFAQHQRAWIRAEAKKLLALVPNTN